MDAVVDGDDGSARRQRRQHVVRRVEQVDCSRRRSSGTRQLLADRVRRPTSPPPRGSSRRAPRAMPQSSPRQSRTYSVVRIDPRQVPQQVADVRADAVVAQLAGVDGDSHWCMRFYRGDGARTWLSPWGSCPFSRRYSLQQRHPARMVLLVERELAAPVGGVHGRRSGGAGAAAQVDDLGRRGEEHAPARARGWPRRSPRPRCTGRTARRAARRFGVPRRTSRQAPLTQST